MDQLPINPADFRELIKDLPDEEQCKMWRDYPQIFLKDDESIKESLNALKLFRRFERASASDSLTLYNRSIVIRLPNTNSTWAINAYKLAAFISEYCGYFSPAHNSYVPEAVREIYPDKDIIYLEALGFE